MAFLFVRQEAFLARGFQPLASQPLALLRACLVFLLACAAPACRAQENNAPLFKGPVDLNNERPYQMLFLQFAPQGGDVLLSGQARHALKLDLAYDYLIPSPQRGATVNEQTETQKLTWEERRGVGHGLELSARLPVVWRDGGLFGRLVDNYHHLIGYTYSTQNAYQGRRDVRPYQSILRDVRADGTVAVDQGAAFGLGDLALTVKQRLLVGRGTAAAARFGLKLPTGNAAALLGSGGVDVGADLDFTTAFSRHLALHADLGYILRQKATRLDNTRRGGSEYALSLENRATPTTSWIVQTEGEEVAYRTGNSFADGTPRQITFGYRRQFSPNTLWTFAFSEGGDIHGFRAPIISNIGPDFVVSAHVEWRR